MIDFTKEVNLAINLICLLTDKPVSAMVLAEKLDVTKSATLNLTHKLSRTGLITTSRGKGGGIVSGKDNPNLYDIFDTLYGRADSNLSGQAAEVHWLMVEALKNISIKANYSTKQYDILDSETKTSVERGLKEAAEGKLTTLKLDPVETMTGLTGAQILAIDEVLKELEDLKEEPGEFTW